MLLSILIKQDFYIDQQLGAFSQDAWCYSAILKTIHIKNFIIMDGNKRGQRVINSNISNNCSLTLF